MHDRAFKRIARIDRKRTILRTGSYPDRVMSLRKRLLVYIHIFLAVASILITLEKIHTFVSYIQSTLITLLHICAASLLLNSLQFM